MISPSFEAFSAVRGEPVRGHTERRALHKARVYLWSNKRPGDDRLVHNKLMVQR